MPIPLQQKIVYGPVASRRFGTSLGVNLLPLDEKWCSFSCAYCQYEDTPTTSTARPGFPTLDELRQALEQPVANTWIDSITIAGNGEPTLHPQFEKAVDEILRFRDRRHPGVPVGILSNGSTAQHPRVRAALGRLDGRYIKLDAGNPRTFMELNRPGSERFWPYLLEALHGLTPITLQSMFVTGSIDNTSPQDVKDWMQRVREVRPVAVQVYTIDRPPATSGLRPVGQARLAEIAAVARQHTGVPIDLYD